MRHSVRIGSSLGRLVLSKGRGSSPSCLASSGQPYEAVGLSDFEAGFSPGQPESMSSLSDNDGHFGFDPQPERRTGIKAFYCGRSINTLVANSVSPVYGIS